jgi:hypothetical protein
VRSIPLRERWHLALVCVGVSGYSSHARAANLDRRASRCRHLGRTQPAAKQPLSHIGRHERTQSTQRRTAGQSGWRVAACAAFHPITGMTRKGSEVRVLYGPPRNRRSERVLGESKSRASTGYLSIYLSFPSRAPVFANDLLHASQALSDAES